MVVANNISDREFERFDTSGAVKVSLQNAMVTVPYDYISLSQNATQDIWSYKVGGAAGTLVATVSVTYTDSTKATISTVVKT